MIRCGVRVLRGGGYVRRIFISGIIRLGVGIGGEMVGRFINGGGMIRCGGGIRAELGDWSWAGPPNHLVKSCCCEPLVVELVGAVVIDGLGVLARKVKQRDWCIRRLRWVCCACQRLVSTLARMAFL
jgi:hypothetical protein